MPSSSFPRLGQDGQSQPTNLLLADVPAEEYENLGGLLESYPLRMRETLQEAGDSPDFVYFPTRGIISVLTVLENGMMIECATVGREGTTGAPVFLGTGPSNRALISRVPGSSLRMKTTDFLAEIDRSPCFAAIIKQYSGMMLALEAQSAACNRAHNVDERCARWLLMTQDQTGGTFPATQEFLAQMLGVSRARLTSAAAALRKAGLISYHRGAMTIVDRVGLQKAACECYGHTFTVNPTMAAGPGDCSSSVVRTGTGEDFSVDVPKRPQQRDMTTQ